MTVIQESDDFLVILSTWRTHTRTYAHILSLYMVFSCHTRLPLPPVDGGERAVIFDRFRGVLPNVVGEGTHFLIPWVQRPIIFSVRSKPRRVPVVTGSKGALHACVCVCVCVCVLVYTESAID